jgi:hypothetical protein
MFTERAQLLQQAILPEGTTRRRIEAETVEVVATPVGETRTASVPNAPVRAESGATAATTVDEGLAGLAGGVFGNGNGNGMPD